ncbi:MAG TPA: hypothetical protein VMP03_15895 [Methylomirabilota bacterium]|nr:hypothetical protein [Methylomirabilota bacterium]
MSALDPAGPSAEAIARLWWVMLAGATLLLALVLTLVGLTFARKRTLARIDGRTWVIGGGLVLPGVVLTALIVFTLLTGERLLARPQEPGAVAMQAVASQFQWRFGPLDGDAQAGPLVIPAGVPVHVHVTSLDVIHSFWVPRLAGKIDAIPGHVNMIRIVAPAPGVYRGVCAEFCGVGHAVMPFVVEAVDPSDLGAEAGR